MPVTVFIVDDSAFFRRRLTDIIDADPRLKVIGTAKDGREAVDLISVHKPDVTTMDLEMPVMDGIAAVRQIMRRRPTPILMLSTWTTDGAKATLDALEAGAMDFLPKRFDEFTEDQHQARQKLCDRIYFLAQHARPKALIKTNSPLPPPLNPYPEPALELVVIGTSTGGPVALQKILVNLPADFPHPIILLQHMPATFTPSFAERLDKQCSIKVKEAQQSETLTAGTAYLAPGGQQLTVKNWQGRRHLKIERGDEAAPYKPCIDITLESIAHICPDKTLTIILTGMGKDGCKGAKILHQQQGTVWAQDEQSSTIYGMPMAVAKAGIADKILSLEQIGQQLVAMR